MNTCLSTNETVELKMTPELKEQFRRSVESSLERKEPKSANRNVEILIVDDDQEHLEELSELLEAEGYSCHKSKSAYDAIRVLNENSGVAIILTDYYMHDLNGLELISFIKESVGVKNDYECVLMTGQADKDIAINSIHLGVEEFLEKPIDTEQLINTMAHIKNKIERKETETRHVHTLETAVLTSKNVMKKMKNHVNTAYKDVIDFISETYNYNDPDAGRHLQRMSAYARFVAKEYGCSEDKQNLIDMAASLYDIGKLNISDNLLMKQGKLTPEEMAVVNTHTEMANSLFSRTKNPVIKAVAAIAGGRYEHWDGTGSPRNLKGDEIPIEARIYSICSVYDALRSPRKYRQGFTHEHVVKNIINFDESRSSRYFDPRIMEIFKNNHQVFDSIYTMSTLGFDIRNYEFDSQSVF